MKEYLTVSKLNQYVKSLVESDFSLMNLMVIGEISSLTKHYTGHYYFTLKDENSQIKCMMFSNYACKIDFNLENGMLVLIQGYLGVFDKSGTYQLYCRQIFLYGEGQYLLNLEKLKQKLMTDGVFDKEKKQIPFLPKRIGLISASTGAAMRDYITTIKKRLNTEIYFFPCLVQGEEAPKSIINAVKESLKYDIDLLVITRGGGSKDDLKVFNDEKLVRYIASLNIPIITAIGHKIDTTLIDYVSSKSCITPTDAAINSVPNKEDLINKIDSLLNFINYKVIHNFEKYNEKIAYFDKIIEINNPINKLQKIKDNINLLNKKLDHLLSSILNNQYQKLRVTINKLDCLNPDLILDNGYGLIIKDNKVISSIEDVEVDNIITIRLKDGEITTIVKEKKNVI